MGQWAILPRPVKVFYWVGCVEGVHAAFAPAQVSRRKSPGVVEELEDEPRFVAADSNVM